MNYFMTVLRRTFWFCFCCSLGGWGYVLGVDARRQMVADVIHWLGRLSW